MESIHNCRDYDSFHTALGQGGPMETNSLQLPFMEGAIA